MRTSQWLTLAGLAVLLSLAVRRRSAAPSPDELRPPHACDRHLWREASARNGTPPQATERKEEPVLPEEPVLAPAIAVPASPGVPSATDDDPDRTVAGILGMSDADLARALGTRPFERRVRDAIAGFSFRDADAEGPPREVDEFLSKLNVRIRSIRDAESR